MALDFTAKNRGGFVAENAQAPVTQYTPVTIHPGPGLGDRLDEMARIAMEAMKPQAYTMSAAPGRYRTPATRPNSGQSALSAGETPTHGVIRLLRD